MKTCAMKDSGSLCLTVYNDGFGMVTEAKDIPQFTVNEEYCKNAN